ncbi:MAG: DNA polymerase III subunit beta, partial [Candidatus Taylorbacteria bacterium]
MKFEINNKKFKDAVALIEHVAGKHITLPVLSSILIEVKKNIAILKATNLDVGIEIHIPVKSTEDGVVAVPAKTFNSFLSQIPEQNTIIQCEVVSGNIQITSHKTRGVIKTVPAEDFPPIPHVENAEQFSVPSQLFVKGLQTVYYSASVSSVKPELSSIYIYKDGNRLVYVATDSFRLAEIKLNIDIPSEIHDILIPYKNVSEIIRVLQFVGGDVDVEI